MYATGDDHEDEIKVPVMEADIIELQPPEAQSSEVNTQSQEIAIRLTDASDSDEEKSRGGEDNARYYSDMRPLDDDDLEPEPVAPPADADVQDVFDALNQELSNDLVIHHPEHRLHHYLKKESLLLEEERCLFSVCTPVPYSLAGLCSSVFGIIGAMALVASMIYTIIDLEHLNGFSFALLSVSLVLNIGFLVLTVLYVRTALLGKVQCVLLTSYRVISIVMVDQPHTPGHPLTDYFLRPSLKMMSLPYTEIGEVVMWDWKNCIHFLPHRAIKSVDSSWINFFAPKLPNNFDSSTNTAISISLPDSDYMDHVKKILNALQPLFRPRALSELNDSLGDAGTRIPRRSLHQLFQVMSSVNYPVVEPPDLTRMPQWFRNMLSRNEFILWDEVPTFWQRWRLVRGPVTCACYLAWFLPIVVYISGTATTGVAVGVGAGIFVLLVTLIRAVYPVVVAVTNERAMIATGPFTSGIPRSDQYQPYRTDAIGVAQAVPYAYLHPCGPVSSGGTVLHRLLQKCAGLTGIAFLGKMDLPVSDPEELMLLDFTLQKRFLQLYLTVVQRHAARREQHT